MANETQVDTKKPSKASLIVLGIAFLGIGLSMMYLMLSEYDSTTFILSILFILASVPLLFSRFTLSKWDKVLNTKAGKIISKPFEKPKEPTAEELKVTREKEKKMAVVLGKIFRPIFIIGVGIYFYSSIPSVSDVPLAGLTLNDIFGFVFGILACLGCIWWLIRTPEEDNYEMWGYFCYLLISIAILGGLLIYKLNS